MTHKIWRGKIWRAAAAERAASEARAGADADRGALARAVSDANDRCAREEGFVALHLGVGCATGDALVADVEVP